MESPRVDECESPGTGGYLAVLCLVLLNWGSLALLTEGLPLRPKFVLLSLAFVPERQASVGGFWGMRAYSDSQDL